MTDIEIPAPVLPAPAYYINKGVFKMRIPLIAGNWKMYKTPDEAKFFAKDSRNYIRILTFRLSFARLQ